MTVRVLFVCLGNICRSPTAHGVFEHLVAQQGNADAIEVDSAGTGNWHLGEPPDRRASQVARQRGYDLSHLRARQVNPGDFDRFDYILAMDRENLEALEAMRPADFDGELKLFLEFTDDAAEIEVPDPYYGGANGFEDVLSLVENGARGLLRAIGQRPHS